MGLISPVIQRDSEALSEVDYPSLPNSIKRSRHFVSGHPANSPRRLLKSVAWNTVKPNVRCIRFRARSHLSHRKGASPLLSPGNGSRTIHGCSRSPHFLAVLSEACRFWGVFTRCWPFGWLGPVPCLFSDCARQVRPGYDCFAQIPVVRRRRGESDRPEAAGYGFHGWARRSGATVDMSRSG